MVLKYLNKIISFIFICSLCLPSFSQSRDSILVVQNVSDSFTKHGIPDACITLADTNGIVMYTLWTQRKYDSNKAFWMGTVARKTQKFLLKAEHPEYETAVLNIEMNKPGRMMEYEFPELLMKRKMNETTLNEVTVSATRVQIAYKGDTIVVNADAFKIPEGSMLDALVASVPGAELRDDGTIYMNGRKVDYLTLNGKDFFKGNNKIMLDNLPYYVVNKLKFYEKDVPRSQMMHQNTGQKDYVMDVEMKQEYSIGYTANAEAGYGTNKRWLGRLFGLRFTDNSRLVIFANANNTNDTRKPGANGWGDASRIPEGEKDTEMIGGSLNIDDKHGRYGENVEASVCWTDNKNETRASNETFLSDGSVYRRSQDISRNKDFCASLSNELKLKKMGLILKTNGSYSKQDGEGLLRSASFSSAPSAFGSCLQVLDSVFSRSVTSGLQGISINRVFDQTKYNSFDYSFRQSIDLDKKLPWGDDLNISVSGDYSKSNKDDLRKIDLAYPNGMQADNRQDQFSSYRYHGYLYNAHGGYTFCMYDYWYIYLRYDYNQQYGKTNSNLYRLDWLGFNSDLGILPSQINYMHAIDPNNSYQSSYLTKTHKSEVGFSHNFYGERYALLFSVYVPVINKGESVRYLKSESHYNLRQYNWFVEPSAWFHYINKTNRSLWLLDNIDFTYQCSVQTPNLVQKIDVYDTSNPLIITKGNSDLKVSRNHYLKLNLGTGNWERYFGLTVNVSILDNMVANGFTYNPRNGVYTYQPENVKGNWRAKYSVYIRRFLDKDKHFQIQDRIDYNYIHNVDLAQVEGYLTSQYSRVNHHLTSQHLTVSYSKETLRAELVGDFAWNVATRELNDINNVNAFDFSYGLSGQYTFPWKIQLATDLKMYSRRGYEEPSMNTNELVWNASVSRPFLKGKLIVKVDAFDILNQLSSTRYVVNGQGRTETWQLSMPRYAMLKVVYKFNKNPKKKQ